MAVTIAEISMTNYSQIIQNLKTELLLSLDHLEYSFQKIQKNALNIETQDPEILETFEALVSRFSRVTDIFIAKYLNIFCSSSFTNSGSFRNTKATPMRLSPLELAALLKELKPFLDTTSEAKVYLFGSRAQDQLKGGDIDLIVLIPDSVDCDRLKKIDYKMISAIKQNPLIGDQKIDLKVISESHLRDPFFASALTNSVLLTEHSRS